jgi:predicted  nucleic acid-binding Zn-ribbon protein
MQVSGEVLAKWFGILITAGTAIGTLYIKINSLEDAKNGHAEVLTEQRREIRDLNDRVSSLERDREMLERVHKIEIRLESIEGLLRDNGRRSRR